MTVYIEIEEGTLQNVYTDSKEDTVVLIDRDWDSEENTLIRILASDGPPPKKILREVERARR